ncbi:MAG: glycoside hydrolase family 105 protein [Bacilli bacterium]
MTNIDIAYKMYEALKTSEERILSGLEPWKQDLQFQRWDWRQGVGLYGIWNLYKVTKDITIRDYLEGYLQRRIDEGQPLEKHINTVCPMLTLISIYEETRNPKYLPLIEEWISWILSDDGLPKTTHGGFSHYCGIKTPNTEQIWDDTLFMTVLFLAKAGVVLDRPEYTEAAFEQFLIHNAFLCDDTGLWYHAYIFDGNHAFSKALWGRGNAWVTASIPEFIEMTNKSEKYFKPLQKILERQVQALEKYQDQESGLWHTLINEDSSYLETTGSAGFTFGIMKAIRLGILDKKYQKVVEKSFPAVKSLIDERGYLRQASDGTPLGLDLDFYRNVALNTRAYAQGLALLMLTESVR